MNAAVLALGDIDRTQVAVVGGKGAHLGELGRIEGVRVPAGFCVTTHAFRRFLAAAPAIEVRLERLARLSPDDRAELASLAAAIRADLEATPIPDEIATAITAALAELGDEGAWAVRSSATAEDSPSASFAGQQDTFLNVVGAASVLTHVRRCWASLFTERAVLYRGRNGLDQRAALMAVVVQRMIVPDASGVMFTADPVSGHRRITSIEATFGLGEAFVSGLVPADVYKVRDGVLVSKAIAAKSFAVTHASPAGGTERRTIHPERQQDPALTDAQAVRLADLGRRIEAHFGGPQDIEWCRVGDALDILQSRPITTLFPVPAVGDGAPHVFVSVGHQQMMTDAMRPLGLSVWQLTAGRPMYEAAGRLFVDVAQALATPDGRAGLLAVLGRSDPLIKDALEAFLARGDLPASASASGPALPTRPPPLIDADPGLVAELVARTEASLAAAARDIAGLSGPALFDFILADIQEMRRQLFDPGSLQAIMTAIQSTWWLDEHLEAWLGDRHAADALAASAPNNVTSEMGLELLKVADVIRPHPEVVAALEHADDGFLDALPELAGGLEARAAIRAFLDRYGARCVGEIDITRPRWAERPATLAPILLGHVRAFTPGAAERRFADGARHAARAEQEILQRLRGLPDGEAKAAEAGSMIARLRAFIGYREYPKLGMVRRYFLYKRALLAEAERLVAAGVLAHADDIFYLTLAELHDAARTHEVDAALVRQRREAFRSYAALTPPRVLTSDGEILTGRYRREGAPVGALIGLAVSAGVVEGRARVVLDIGQANLAPGEILVTPFTDPSWTPLFLGIAGLVTEVGGLMTHGSVIAREYGLPAVVGVEQATTRIRDGQRIRVDGGAGLVELLS